MEQQLDAGRRLPTMREVAALAQVSLKTVSRVVNREPGVSAQLAERVQQAVRLLDYRHNIAASGLRRADRRTASIGLLLEDVANPLASAIHRAIEDGARLRGSLVFAGSSDGDPARELEFVRRLASRQVDGLIVEPVEQDHRGLLHERRLGLPMVFIDRLASAPDVDSVTSDNRGGARAAVLHLAEHGHQHIAFLGDLRSIWTADERYVGYVEGLAMRGMHLLESLVKRDLRSDAEGEWAAGELLDTHDPPTAFFAAQNLLTIGVVRALQRRGLQCRVALVGFDDVPLADLLSPPISVVAQDPRALGDRAADRLFARLEGDERAAEHVQVPTRLIARGSGEIWPA